NHNPIITAFSGNNYIIPFLKGGKVWFRDDNLLAIHPQVGHHKVEAALMTHGWVGATIFR
ncbi:MAG: hypothetical protein OXI96_06560, partial [Acidimicrobiaceae bacterium]|nr:hypothetical protein [Acidimicrobiaceae bacterium]